LCNSCYKLLPYRDTAVGRNILFRAARWTQKNADAEFNTIRSPHPISYFWAAATVYSLAYPLLDLWIHKEKSQVITCPAFQFPCWSSQGSFKPPYHDGDVNPHAHCWRHSVAAVKQSERSVRSSVCTPQRLATKYGNNFQPLMQRSLGVLIHFRGVNPGLCIGSFFLVLDPE